MTKIYTNEGATFTKLEKFNEFDVDGSWNVGVLNDVSYAELIDVFGQPTYDTESGDSKVQMEWVIEVNDGGKVYNLRIYDWKTYDRNYTKTKLKTWSIGGNDKANPYLLKSFLAETKQINIL